MLSYRHAFHAGNFADILKHLVLVSTLHYATRKVSPLFYLDTHAGAGLYDLDSAEAKKTGEAAAGVLALDVDRAARGLAPDAAEPLGLFRQAIAPFLAKHRYPGSPLLAAAILRRQDHAHLCELHPTDYDNLRHHVSRFHQLGCDQADGYRRALSLIPPIQNRCVVLIDPSYERDEDYRQAVAVAAAIHARMPAAQVLVWYPVVNRHWVKRMTESLVRKRPRDLWCFELGVRQDDDDRGMTGSGLLAINPPWTLPGQLEACLPRLQAQLAGPQGYWSVTRLTDE